MTSGFCRDYEGFMDIIPTVENQIDMGTRFVRV